MRLYFSHRLTFRCILTYPPLSHLSFRFLIFFLLHFPWSALFFPIIYSFFFFFVASALFISFIFIFLSQAVILFFLLFLSLWLYTSFLPSISFPIFFLFLNFFFIIRFFSNNCFRFFFYFIFVLSHSTLNSVPITFFLFPVLSFLFHSLFSIQLLSPFSRPFFSFSLSFSVFNSIIVHFLHGTIKMCISCTWLPNLFVFKIQNCTLSVLLL